MATTQPQFALPVSQWSPGSLWGVSAPPRQQNTLTNIPGVERSAGPGSLNTSMLAKVWHPENPVFWVGAFLLAAAGLIAGATEVRIGPARAGVSVGG